MAAYNIVLQLFKMSILNSPLSHWTKARIDAIDDFVLGEFFQKIIACDDLAPEFF